MPHTGHEFGGGVPMLVVFLRAENEQKFRLEILIYACLMSERRPPTIVDRFDQAQAVNRVANRFAIEIRNNQLLLLLLL